MAVAKPSDVKTLNLVPPNTVPGQTRKEGGRMRSMSTRTVTLKILGSDEVMQVACMVCTTVAEVKEMLAQECLVEPHNITFLQKQGTFAKPQLDVDQVVSNTIVKGIKSFKPEKMKWPHPIGVIGAGYHGLKTLMTYVIDNDFNLVCFDRNEVVGGYCWLTGANKTSRLQTEFGAFHIWWGQHCIDSGKIGFPDCNKPSEEGGWHIWPYKEEINRMFRHAADTFGLNPYIIFKTNVSHMDIVGHKDAEERYYKLTTHSVNNVEQVETYNVSAFFSFPGSLTRNRIIDYPGEDIFDGEIRYGMNDDTPYEELKGSTIAILGNGAFAVENARTAIECGGVKAYIVTRRKNLASPRLPCWFVHQGPLPTPGYMVLNMFEPMYQLANFGDPWKYWSVHSNHDRTHVTILQNSRFGIGDVTFLMVVWGLLEYIEATVKRFAKHTLHLSTGEKIEGVTICLKALGLLGDYSVDKLHGMKEMVGNYCGGDWRRPLMIDATGMNAANFTTFSTGIGTTAFALTNKFLFDYPKEFYRIDGLGFMKALPRHKEEPEVEKPAYLTEVKYAMTTGIILDSMCPKQMQLDWAPTYKYQMYHWSHGLKRTLEVARFEWFRYQEQWKARGIEHEPTPYPYTEEIVQKWCDDYERHVKVKIYPDGRDPDWRQLLGNQWIDAKV